MNTTKWPSPHELRRHTPPALARWKFGHRLFFVIIQGLVIAHAKMLAAHDQQSPTALQSSLIAATNLFWAAAAAFRFTGQMTAEEYNTIVRPTMEPPHAKEGFSGVLGVDHIELIKTMKRLERTWPEIPPNTRREHHRYLTALNCMYTSHQYVCAKFVPRGNSLRTAVAIDSTPAQALEAYKSRTLNFAGARRD